MNSRFSKNGDGKDHAPTPRISAPLDAEQHREQQIIKNITGRYDQIELLWNEAEEDLKRFRVPHSVDYVYDEEDYQGGNICPRAYFLGWMRYGKGWRICCGYRAEHLDNDRYYELDYKPVTECTLDTRVAMMHHYKALREKVVATAEGAVPQLDEAIANFRQILKS
jgi:hypothetical protein